MKNQFKNLMLAITLVAASTMVQAQTPNWLTAGNTATAAYKLGTNNNMSLNIVTNGTTRMTVLKQTGFVGIGTTAPITKLEVANGDATIYGVTVGRGAGAVNSNAVLGPQALTLNTSGYYNTATGAYALNVNTTGYRLTASGYQSLSFNTTGYYNSGYGVNSLRFNTTGSFNTAIGDNSMVTGTTSYANTAVGQSSMYYITSGQYNTASGTGVLENITTGSYNAVFGSQAFLTNTTGSNNTGLGYGADVTSGGLVDASAIGYNSKVCSSYMMVFGDTAVTKWGLGVCPGANAAIQVGTNATNGNGAYLTPGGVWTDVSDRTKKEDFTTLDKNDILQKISKLNITRWKYSGTNNEYHIGPMADDFSSTFSVGDNSGIAAMDKAGVALIGIQQLSKTNDELKSQVESLQANNQELTGEVDDLKLMLSELKAQVQSLDVSLSQCCSSYQQSKTSASNSDAKVSAYLYEITPNPLSQKATVTYTLPSDASDAQLIITDASGKVMNTYTLSTGSTQQVINASKFVSGTYQYSLTVNGKMIDSKQMVITK